MIKWCIVNGLQSSLQDAYITINYSSPMTYELLLKKYFLWLTILLIPNPKKIMFDDGFQVNYWKTVIVNRVV